MLLISGPNPKLISGPNPMLISDRQPREMIPNPNPSPNPNPGRKQWEIFPREDVDLLGSSDHNPNLIHRFEYPLP